MDLEALVTDELREEIPGYHLEWFDVEASSRRPPHATVAVRLPDGTVAEGSFTGDGPVDAIFRAINAATGLDARLREFRVDAVTGGQDALGETSVVLEVAGQTAAGQGVATDIIEAAARAYVRALSQGVRKAEAASPASPELTAAPWTRPPAGAQRGDGARRQRPVEEVALRRAAAQLARRCPPARRSRRPRRRPRSRAPRAMPTIARTIALVARRRRRAAATNERSIFSTSIGSRWR